MRGKPDGKKLPGKPYSLHLDSIDILSARDDNKYYHHHDRNISSNENSEKYYYNQNYDCRRQERVVTPEEEEITFQFSNMKLQNIQCTEVSTGTHTEIKCASNICQITLHEYDNEIGKDNANKISTEDTTDDNITETADVREKSALIPRGGKTKSEKKIRSNRAKKEYEKFCPIVENLQSPSENNINNITETRIDELPSCSLTLSIQEPNPSAYNSSEQSEESIPVDLEDVCTPYNSNLEQDNLLDYTKIFDQCPEEDPLLQVPLPSDHLASKISTTQNFNATSQGPSQMFQNQLNQYLISQPYREQLLKRLHPTKKKEALVKISLVPDSALTTPDEDGDTFLMCLVSQPHDSLLELVFFTIERIRNIQNALNHKNNVGQTALFVASMNQPQEPLIACYIAATLLDLGVDIAQERYWRGLTLIERLRYCGKSHENVLTSLLNLKDASGKTVFNF